MHATRLRRDQMARLFEPFVAIGGDIQHHPHSALTLLGQN
jgi:hypothetical protein